jgi:hypothetical protein
MASAARPGTVTPQQLSRLRRKAEVAGVNDGWLFMLAKSNRNAKREAHRGAPDEAPKLSALGSMSDLSMFEASDLIAEIETAIATGERVRSVCARCLRLGFVGAVPCMHDGAGSSEEQRRVQSFERERGRW